MLFILKTLTDRVTLAPLNKKDYFFNVCESFRIFLILAAILKNAVHLQNHVSCPFPVDITCIWPQMRPWSS